MLQRRFIDVLSIAKRDSLAQQLRTLVVPSAPALFPDVIVPALGESISEGSVSAVLKQVGEEVKADDPIAQVETDKVTVDIKSPHAGVLEALKVKVGDVVKPGSVVASVGNSTSSSSRSPTQSSQPNDSSAAQPPASDARPPEPPATSAVQPEPSHGVEERPHMIHFPARMRDGRRVSELPASTAGDTLPPPPPPPGPSLSSNASAVASSGIAQVLKPPAQRSSPTAYPTAPGPPVSSQTTRLSEAPPRRGLTNREIEAINLGGLL